jgi:hypothetical protein
MAKASKILIGVLLVLFGVLIYFQTSKPAPLNWEFSYQKDNTFPYGSQLLYENLNVLFPDSKISTSDAPAQTYLRKSKDDKSNYVVICEKFKPNAEDANELLDFVNKGNSVFIAANVFEGGLAEELHISVKKYYSERNGNYRKYYEKDNGYGELYYHVPSSVAMCFSAKKFDEENAFFFDRDMPDYYFEEYRKWGKEVLGVSHEGNVNFIKLRWGSGYFYLHTQPTAFANYYIAHPYNHEYAFTALSHLPVQETCWDEYYKIDRDLAATPLSFILSQNPLRYAMYLLGAAILLFIVFRAKRKERMMPIVEPHKNTSVEFTDTISELYYQQGVHRNIANKKIGYFLEFMRRKFHVKTANINDELKEKVSVLSGVSRYDVDDLFKTIVEIQQQGMVNERELLELNQKIEHFLKHNKR